MRKLASYSIKRGIRGDLAWLAIGILSVLVLRERAKALQPVWKGKVAAGERLSIVVAPAHGRE
ncbi:MAG: hypothetical protein ACYDGY_03395 [Acidimicrobiales bacterium]